MKMGEDFRREFPQPEEGFRAAEYQALMRLKEEKRRLHMKFKPVIAFVLMLILLMSVGVAATVEKWSLFDSVPDDWRIATDAEKAQMKSSFVPIAIDGKMVDVTLREAIYDGYGVYLVVDVTPKSPNVFLIPYHNADLDEPAGDVVSSFPDDVTLEEHIRALGKRENVIIVSARNAIEDRVQGLDLGADDYLPKPFHTAELVARVRSVLRRGRSGGELKIEIGNVSLSPSSRQVKVEGQELSLLKKEFDILLYFMQRPAHMIDKTMLAESVWGDYVDDTDNFQFVYAQIKNLRRKLADAKASIEISSVYGFGYKLIEKSA